MTTAAPPTARVLVATDVMTAPAITITPATTPWAAWSVLVRHDIRHLVVIRDGRCVGILDDRAIFSHWPMGPLALRRSTIAGMIRTRTSCVLPTTPLSEVAHVMNLDHVDAVPVVDSRGWVLGLVTAGDVVAAVARHGVRDRSAEVPA